ncbi:Os02g0746400 [Oryza sativa Japonica Group]|nr:Os02g0746400 [Oryza sativa Japonica Group]
MERCQRVLFKRLGILNDEGGTSIEQVLAQYIAMFNGLLPPHIIAALTAIFGIDDDEQDAMDAALISLVGEGVAEVADEVEKNAA